MSTEQHNRMTWDGRPGHYEVWYTTLSGAGHDCKWDLHWRPADTVHLHLPTMLYKGSFGDTRVLSPNLDVAARGEIVVDGERYVLDGEPAGQSHVWGKKHAYQWGW